ncbi:peptide-methionine (S)-S-oxide reductase [Jejuia spongiicola]|uniref:peptide-methionine (S)-S-oxide reductase n=1 Tax=Jejuia spongiicola TaxID=2942207 RepID=A0ABT0QAQ2_9FLAO|nr:MULTISPECIES: peptide-methionine (S)-S-oxide reductase [Flavobacteriaceae]MCL6294013.1 peptide-methionine (S)-S-oxide reductase [Jejuia spongiicola]PIA78459.1 peptide methionine sulfoxide reductase [Gaetbulibacter sp. 4G1]
MDRKTKVALGGGCHWCTEAVFQSLKGVEKVEQGYVSSVGENQEFSEAVVVHFNTEEITLETLIEIHLHTHKSNSNHSMRNKYRSAVYTFSSEQENNSKKIIENLQKGFDDKIITKVFPFLEFKASREAIQNYYQKNPNKPFCETFINPKLQLLLDKFSNYVDDKKVEHLIISI